MCHAQAAVLGGGDAAESRVIHKVKPMKTKTSPLTFFFIALMLASLACAVFVGGPEYPAQTVPVSADEVQNMRTQIEQAFVAGAETGIVTLQIT